MCLMLYLASAGDLAPRRSPELTVEVIEGQQESVRQWFSLPTVRFIGAHTGCSCGFPSVSAEQPVVYFDGMFRDDEDREKNLRSLQSLLTLVGEQVTASGEVQLYAVWNGDEGNPPKGTIEVAPNKLDAGTFFFNEQFLYRVTRERE